jgi:hypothetical protein
MSQNPQFPQTAREALRVPKAELAALTPPTAIDPKVQAEIDLVLKILPSAIIVARQAEQQEVLIYSVNRRRGDIHELADARFDDEPTTLDFLQRRATQIQVLDSLFNVLKVELEGTGAEVVRKEIPSGCRDGRYGDGIFIVFPD